MEVEAFPIGFTKGIRSHWRRRKYQRLENGDGGGRTKSTQRLGGGARRGSGSGGWRVRLRGLILRRVRVVRAVVALPGRLLCRLRDAYVGGMLAVARKAAVTAVPSDGMWTKRVPRRKHQKLLLPGTAAAQGPSEFEKRLVMEIYKSIVASKELTTMLHSSATTASSST
ncbi:uncharacterized protein LOC124705697 [Lolium rigidum]|uniref:uncharacterized protein LOC124705697 n=1 Tax=Lolium rigidum TaxID=89674 RepID=UPI001F5D4DF1|nr:uncharacterized protein LOC124705697 [Lolium rigidum]